MFISIGLIVEQLKHDYEIEAHIQHNSLQLRSVCIYSEFSAPSHFAILDYNHDILSETHPCFTGKSCILKYKDDYVLIFHPDIYEVLNKIIFIFDYYFSFLNERLPKALRDNDYRQVIRLANEVLNNPIILLDSFGVPLNEFNSIPLESCCSACYSDCSLSQINSNYFLSELLNGQLFTQQGIPISQMEACAHSYMLSNGITLVARHILQHQCLAGVFCVLEIETPLLSSHIQFVDMFCDIISDSMLCFSADNLLTPHSQILSRLLLNESISIEQTERIVEYLVAPWTLLIIKNLYRTSSMYSRQLIRTFRTQSIPFIHSETEDYIVVLLSQTNVESFTSNFTAFCGKKNYIIIQSLDFSDLQFINAFYNSALFALSQIKESGIYSAENYILSYWSHKLSTDNDTRVLSHPVLSLLEEYDLHHNSEYYKTLYYYLRNERSLVKTAEALHIHRNSLVFRIEKINEFIHVDLDDFYTRTYILSSFILKEHDF